jgi:hypothetical protein
MSRMSDLSIDIQAMLEDGHEPRAIARYLEIPVEWVYEELSQESDKNEELFSPFETVNS